MPFLENTGDGTCLFHAISSILFDNAMHRRLPLAEKSDNYVEFLQHFATFHSNFNPVTIENFYRWISHYCQSPRDVELLISPVLRIWYESQNEKISVAEAARRLPKQRHVCTETVALDWLCSKLGFNLYLSSAKFQDAPEDKSEIIGRQPGPEIFVQHVHNNHFNAHVSDEFIGHFTGKESSVILAHHGGNTNSAYNFTSKPLPIITATQSEIRESIHQNPVAFYQNLMHQQIELQRRAFGIKQQECVLSGEHFEQDNPLYQSYDEIDPADYPDDATMITMFKLLQEEKDILDNAESSLQERIRDRARL